MWRKIDLNVVRPRLKSTYAYLILLLTLLIYGVTGSAILASVDVPFMAVLNAGQEAFNLKQRSAPPTSSGIGNAMLNYHDKSRKVCYSISFQHLDGKETEAHFHAPAPIGENAPVLFFISPLASGGPSAFGVPKVGCVGPLNKQELRWLRKGLWYLNIHTDKFPGGEIRGQVLSPQVSQGR